MDKALIIIGFIIAGFWFCAPFELYGINSKLEKILDEIKKKGV